MKLKAPVTRSPICSSLSTQYENMQRFSQFTKLLEPVNMQEAQEVQHDVFK